MSSTRQFVDECIEKELSEQLEAIGNTEATIVAIGEMVETAYESGLTKGNYLRPALEILIGKILEEEVATKEYSDGEISKILSACKYAVEYYYLRDLIFYSYGVESSVIWTKQGDTVNIEVNDPSIFRQYIAELQSFFLNSLEYKQDAISHSDVLTLLNNTKHWDIENPNVKKVIDSIDKEVEWKISHMFSGVPHNSGIDIGGYPFSYFVEVYKNVLYLSLYERVYSTANGLSHVITYTDIELSRSISESTLIAQETCLKILVDISISSKCSFVYSNSTGRFLLFPYCFSLRDGISDILKLFARVDEKGFSSRCAGIIGNTLTSEIAGYFCKFKNFKAIREISLQKYGSHLPDIDLLIISYEPSLGFHFYVCELKNTLYASWAKEYLKATGKKGYIEKAINQVEQISKFLESEQGGTLLYDIVRSNFKYLNLEELFPTGFCSVINFLIISSQSVGMFYPDLQLSIVNEQILRKIVEKSDGDTNYITFQLRSLSDQLDNSLVKSKSEVKIGATIIQYNICSLKHIIAFADHKYLSSKL